MIKHKADVDMQDSSVRPGKLTAEEPLSELALIFVAGMQRLRAHPESAPGPEKTAASCLDVGEETVLSGGCCNGPLGPNKTSQPGATNT